MSYLLLAATLICALGGVNGSHRYTISVVAPELASAPVRIVAFESSRNHSAQVVVKNFSSKAVMAAYLDEYSQAPIACPGKHRVIQTTNDSRAYKLSVPIPPGKKVRLDKQQLDPAFMLAAAKDSDSSYLQVQIAVVEVEFADGTKWKMRPKPGEMFDPSLSAAEAASCRNAPSPAPFRGVRYQKREELNQGKACGAIEPKLEEAALGFRLVCQVHGDLVCCPDY